MTTLYRIQTPNGKGMCMITGSVVCLTYRLATMGMGPHMQEREHCHACNCDLKEKERHAVADMGWRYAFPSIDKLKAWFPSAIGRAVMAEIDKAEIVVLEVPDEATLTNGWQTTYDPARAVEVRTMDLRSI